MCSNTTAPSEEEKKELEIFKYVEDKIERIRTFYDDLRMYGYTIISMLEGIVERDFLKRELSFSVGIEYQGELLLPDENTGCWKQQRLGKFEIQQDTYGLIKKCFLDQKDLMFNESVNWCRCVGGLSYPQIEGIGTGCQIYVYYFIALNGEMLDVTFLHCAEEVYYEWFVSQLSAVLHAVSPEKVIQEMDHSTVLKQFQRNIADNFNRYMWDIFSIEPEIITAISGIYYEGETCCSKLSFCLTDIENEEVLSGVILDCPISVETQKIKRIRKLLQMGKEGQCLLVCRRKGQWQVRGLYAESEFFEKSINFQITKHMVWRMTVGEKLAVCFENGNYVITSREFEFYKLKEKYETLFAREFNEEIETVCREAVGQKHGTTLIIIEKRQSGASLSLAEQEVDRLIKESTGMKMKPMRMAEGFVNSVTSIDGALIADSDGICYGFAMILDGPGEGTADQSGENQEEKRVGRGNADYGARHNSANRYINRCRDNGITAMAVVVSEDGPVTVFTTDDDGKGGKGDAK